MPPKKKEPEKAVFLGRVGHSLKMGVVGLPNVGKSCFFNVLTHNNVPSENYPFCTIDPTEGRVTVPDERFDWLCDHFRPHNKVPAFLKITDIAGLVRGAHTGDGLGNAFLSHIRACDGIFNIIRVFEEEEVSHTEGDVNPVRDLEIIANELIQKDIQTTEKSMVALEKAIRGNNQVAKMEYETLEKIKQLLEEGKNLRSVSWINKEVEVINKHQFLTAKPVIYLINMSVEDFNKGKNKWLKKIKTHIDEHDLGASILPFSAALEANMLQAANDEGKTPELSRALSRIIKQGYLTMRLHHFFTTGSDEVKCWTIHAGTKCPQAAGRIHTDMEKGFIMAEVTKYEELRASVSDLENDCKSVQRGREYVVEDGDIILFKFNAGAGLQKKKKIN